MRRPRHRSGPSGVPPLRPPASVELVLPDVVAVLKVRVGRDVAGVTTEDEHGGAVHNGAVVVPGRQSIKEAIRKSS